MADNTVKDLDTLSFKATGNLPVQFGRVIEFDVLNFNLGKKVTFPNDLMIKFKFFKSTDEVREASTGEVVVSNISDETYDLVKTPNACQMVLRAGYIGAVDVVFFADIVSCKKTVDGNDTHVTFNVSANYFEYKLNYGVTISKNDGYTIDSQMKELFAVLNTRNQITGKPANSEYYFTAPTGFTDEDLDAYWKYLKTANYGDNFAFQGSLDKVMGEVCMSHGMSITTSIQDDKTLYLISVKDSHLNFYLEKIYSSYPVYGTVTESNSKIYNAIDENKAVVLSYKTGLLGTPHIDHKVFTVPENYKGLSTDQTTLKSQIAINAKEAKEQERLAKYKEKGSSSKPFKARKLGTKRIKKTYLSVKAQLNPQIRPQSIIRIDSMDSDYSGLYRVRNVTYEGDNRSGNFLVDLYLEDTNEKKTVSTTEKDTESDDNKSFGSDTEAYGSLGSDVGSEDISNDSSGNGSVEVYSLE